MSCKIGDTVRIAEAEPAGLRAADTGGSGTEASGEKRARKPKK
jgi:hypothetical protein